jgi:hypothetical protein
MRIPALLIGLALGASTLGSTGTAAELGKLKAVYVCDPGTPRAKEFESFLQKNLGQVVLASRTNFRPAEAQQADVVLLDWPQSQHTQEDWKRGWCPLGDRGQWHKPTVLLGSAGLNLAVVWKLRGGAG